MGAINENSHSGAFRVNRIGETVGSSTINELLDDHAVYFFQGNVENLGTLPGGNKSFASGINSFGVVVGDSNISPLEVRAFRKDMRNDDSEMQNLGTLGGNFSAAEAVNDNGIVVGCSKTQTNDQRAFIWTEFEGMQPLATFNSHPYDCALDINKKNVIVGYSLIPNLPGIRPTLWLLGTRHLVNLGDLGGGEGKASSINNKGDVVGYSTTTQGEQHAFLLIKAMNHNMIDLGVLNEGDFSSQAWGINNRKQAVGWSTGSENIGSAFVWDREHGMRDLNKIVKYGMAPWKKLEVAQSINDRGEIVGRGLLKRRDPQGNYLNHAFKLVPLCVD